VAVSETPGSGRFPHGTVGDMSARVLHGRERELSILNGMVDRLAAGTGGALILRGDPGIGKSALLAAVAATARDSGIEILTAVGVQSEARLPFAGLHQLLRPRLRLAEGLPARQRAALLAGFGGSEDVAAELYLIALATLELISDAAASSPVLLIVEDAQWLDQPSCTALAFVARRLAAEPAVLLIATRDGPDSPFDGSGLPDLRLAGLDEQAAGALLDTYPTDLGPVVRERLLQDAAGNPLALVELPAALLSEHLGDSALVPSLLPLTARLERAFAMQEMELPVATRSLLLVAAADDDDALGELLSAASVVQSVPVTVDAVTPAVVAGLVKVTGGRLRFRHPLVRSAIYQAANLAQCHAAHAALAEVLAGQPDRRVWHRAAATFGPDEDLAAGLDEAAARAERRGAVSVAIRAHERAAELSDGPARRGVRLLRAAEMAFELGRQKLGLRLLRAAEPLALAAQERTRLSWLREIYDGADWSGAARVGSFVEIAPRIRLDGHPDFALKVLHTVALRCWWGNPDEETRAAVVAAAERIPVPEDEPALLAVLAHADPVKRGAVVVERISRMTPDAGDPAGMHLVGTAANAVWAYDLSLGFLGTAVDGLRAQGRMGLLAQALVAQAWAVVHLAREPLAVSAAEEAWRLTRETGQPQWAASARLAQATIAAQRGDVEVAEVLVSEAEGLLVASGAGPMLALGQFVRGRGAVAHHRYAEGFEHHRRTLDPDDPAYHPYVGAWGLSDLVEAAAHSGRPDSAKEYLAQLESLAATTSGSLLRAEAGFARPMVAADDDAEALYEAALGRDLGNWPCYRGRMLLLYGRWLRRRRRVAESRVPLRAAREGFDALAFPRLAEAARQELRAAGETGRRRVPEAWDELTPQELQIGRMAAQGLSNREIGEQLCLSHRTVGYHLHRIFPKLGITSRSQLHAAVVEVAAPH
jgi:DNA-binding CsgD family transcriptional regulator